MTDYFQSIDKNIKTLVVQIGQNVKSNQDQKKNLDILTKKAQEQAEKDENSFIPNRRFSRRSRIAYRRWFFV